jgi:hypothetical protein
MQKTLASGIAGVTTRGKSTVNNEKARLKMYKEKCLGKEHYSYDGELNT